MDAKKFREAAHAAIEDIISYFTSLPSLRVTPSISPGYLAPKLPDHAPLDPQPFSDVMQDVKEHIVPGLTHWQSPNFMAFFPAHTTYPSLLGELYSAAFNAPAFNWVCSPACTELETVVLDWVARMLGLPDSYLSTGGRPDGKGEGGGVIQGSASEALLVCMIAAREQYVRKVLEEEKLLPESEDDSEERVQQREDRSIEIRSKLVALGSSKAHSSSKKAANILGLRYRSVTADAASGFVMTAQALQKRVEEVKRQGLVPFFLTTLLGTTSTCGVDDFEGITKFKKEQCPDLWLHVDAAYAGSVLVCPEMREEAGAKWLGDMDSFDLNLHKWLLVNFDASCLFVRNRSALTSALSITPAYLINPSTISGLVTDYRDWQIPLGRRFRALKIWFVLRTYGVTKMQDMIRRHCRLGELFADLCTSPTGRKAGIRVVTGPKYALTVIRIVGAENSAATVETGPNREDEMNDFGLAEVPASTADNALTQKVYELINSRGELFLTSDSLDGTYCIRVVGANENTSEESIRRAFGIIVESIGEVKAALGTESAAK